MEQNRNTGKNAEQKSTHLLHNFCYKHTLKKILMK